jgi:hypothetical protein
VIEGAGRIAEQIDYDPSPPLNASKKPTIKKSQVFIKNNFIFGIFSIKKI